MDFLKKNIGAIILFVVIAGIATCNYRLNSAHQQEIIDNPKPGDFFVFQDYPEKDFEAIMKIKEVTESDITLFIPQSEIIGGFELNKSENVVRDADKEGQMYGTATLTLSKEEIKEMIENNTISGASNDKPRLEFAF
jgi:hypothetical protein